MEGHGANLGDGTSGPAPIASGGVPSHVPALARAAPGPGTPRNGKLPDAVSTGSPQAGAMTPSLPSRPPLARRPRPAAGAGLRARRRRPDRRPLRTAVTAAAAAAVVLPLLPTAATADSFVFRDGRDVRTVNAADDRTGLTITGDGQYYATLPTMDDAGNLSVIVRKDGSFVPELVWFGADGRVVRNQLPEEGSVGLNTGPLSVRVDPTGKLYAYTYLKWQGVDRNPTPQLAIVDPSAALAPVPAISQPGASHATWFDGRLVVSNGSDLFAETSATSRFDFAPWTAGAGATSSDITRDGRRAIIGAGSRRQLVAELSPGGPPGSTVTASCVLPDDGSDLYRGGASSAAITPDGRHVAWSGQGGLRTAAIGPISGTDGACPLSDVRVISAKGGLPSASGFTVADPSADPPAGGGAPDPPAQQPPAQQTPGQKAPDAKGPGPSKRAAKVLTVAAPKRTGTRVAVSFVCGTRCTYDARLMRGKRTLKRRTGSAKAGKRVRVVLTGARGKGLKVRVEAGGKTTTRSVR